ncbi:sporulation and cell division repeat protein [Bacteroides pyogenes F0041]|uniref:Sporulation and cell division repeat protein n=1 Tax=Bacteroides pyogenes F0041 TaxID=1321819 RepID=U2DVX8_9BACE|nr:SPOR domain-containing protein [Bacteroides pyogenes]ERI85792.1 sporulation and cell division repeat protein [Bacteroides pyogenes F0041]MBB3895571.1 hypothetical protein [Bacteroides pyogenes]GAE22026.1 hypothetical protein JCM10003_1563 [Bacteroides pyogenes JCM 10003]SUV34585.1 Sporulation related domain [Bacteroides pyogenes]
MIKLAQHIEALLLENDCVIVPGFGGFVTHYDSAKYIKKENLFLPPVRSIGFNPQLRLNDGVLIQSYMAARDTSFADAARMVDKEVNQLIHTLHDEGKIYLDNIGEIFYNLRGDYEFKPYIFKVATPSLYGLDTFEILQLAALKAKESAQLPADTTEKGKTYEIRINRAFLRNAIAMIATIAMFFAFSTPVENTRIRQTNYAQLLSGELFQQIEKQSVAVTPVHVNSVMAHLANATSASQKKAHITDESVTTKDIKKNKPETNSTVEVQPILNAPFHLIVIGGISLKDAEAVADNLRIKGFTQARVLNEDGKVRVSIHSFNNREEATEQLLELRKNEAYHNAWLLVK